ncbi:hypothetical protein [Demequina activiva]|uniref:Uncharacterized protein n=1 Tax=Demequina activiva TaxID=1582364 RepID=A0A919UKW5_9MICO|nr:hypothetical protein [Demequina activiva]GIG54118.1 hypothetical protein Dac01nite_08700 [Demequina activiva]
MISTRIWNALPGPALVRLLILLIVVAAVVLVLFEYVFPWISEYLALQETTVEET